jgi:hypothetical protein
VLKYLDNANEFETVTKVAYFTGFGKEMIVPTDISDCSSVLTV